MPEQQPQPRRSARAHRAGMPFLRVVREPAPPVRSTSQRRPGQVDVDLRSGRALPTLDGPATRRHHGLLPGAIAQRAGVRVGVDTDPIGHARTGISRLSQRARIAIISILLVQAVFGGLILWAVTSPTWQVRWVRVDGTQDATLLSVIHKLPLTGCNVFHCDTHRAAALVAGLPLVAHAEAHVSYPDGLVVTVTTRTPALIWNTGDQAEVVTSDGVVLGPVGADPALTKTALPEVMDAAAAAFGGHDPTPGARIDAPVVRMAGQLRMGLAGALGDGWVLEYTAGSGLEAANSHGQTVLFGTPVDAVAALSSAPGTLGRTGSPSTGDVDRGTAVQLDEARQIMTALAKQGETPTLIDVRWGAHPYYRLSA